MKKDISLLEPSQHRSMEMQTFFRKYLDMHGLKCTISTTPEHPIQRSKQGGDQQLQGHKKCALHIFRIEYVLMCLIRYCKLYRVITT